MSPASLTVIQVVVGVLMLVVVPLGLGLVEGAGWAARWWPVAGAAGAVSVWLPRGAVAVVLAAGYTLACVGLVGLAARRAARWWSARRSGPGAHDARTTAPVELAVVVALGTPLVGAVALVAERAGQELFGFDLDVLALTVPHMHAAGFAGALVAGLVSRASARGGVAPGVVSAAALTVPVGTVLVLVGYFVGDWAELVGAVVLTAGMWLVAWLTWTRLRPAAGRRAAALLGTGAAVLSVTMVLALAWAVGQAFGVPHPSLDWMVATHGVVNALGFAVCSMVAWRMLTREAL